MSSAYTLLLKLCAPVDPSGKAVTSPFEIDIAGTFTFFEELPAIALTGSGTFAVPLGGVPSTGLKVLVLELDPTGSPAAISAAWANVTSGSGGITEITATPGAPGVIFLHDPNPSNGVASVTVTHSGPVTLRGYALG